MGILELVPYTMERRTRLHYPGACYHVILRGNRVPICRACPPPFDPQCGAKIFRNTKDIRAIFAEKFTTRWIFDVEIFARFILILQNVDQDLSDVAIEHPLEEWHDVPGSKLKYIDFIRACMELIVLKRGQVSF